MSCSAVARSIPRRARLLGRAFGKTLRLPPRELLTTLHAAGVIAVVELLIRWVPLPRLSRLLGVPVDLGPRRTDVEQLRESELPERAERQLRCARRVADAWPFSRGPCLRGSLVTGHLLRRHHPALRLGMIGTDGTFLAHAWVEIDERPLEPIDGYTVFQHTPAGVAR